MGFSELFIRRPVATCLLTLGLMLAGVLGYLLLPISSLPQVDMPTISVQASLPGASAEVMATSVAMPLERQFGHIAGLTEMTSSSSQGMTRVNLQFELGMDVGALAREVQAGISAASALLPAGMPSQPTYRKANVATSPIVALALTSDVRTREQLYDVAFSVLGQRIAQIPGVGQINVNGSALPAVRIEVDPGALAQQGIGLDTVRTALGRANLTRPKGMLEDADRHWLIEVNERARRAEDYRDLIITWRNGAPVRLRDVAQVRDSVQELRNAGTSNGEAAVMLSVFNQPGENVVETVDAIRALLPQLEGVIAEDIELRINMDRSTTVRATLKEVRHTLMICIALVILVVYLFLRSARATFIPLIAIPASLLGTLLAIYLLGYSLNNLSLMALIIATSFVVDDAIILVEHSSRLIERGLSPLAAALRSVREVGFTVLAMNMALIAVFIPVLLMDGIIGRLLREFAVTLSIAVVLSLLISLTTTPMLCAQVLRPQAVGRSQRRGLFALLAEGYRRSLGWALGHRRLMLSLLLATVVLNLYLFTAIPKGFFPHQDTGRLQGFFHADQSLSFAGMREKVAQLMEIIGADPDVATYYEYTGGGSGGQGNSGMMFASLVPRDQREASGAEIVARLRARMAQVPGITLFLLPQQDIHVGGRQGSALYQYTLYTSDVDELSIWAPRVRDALLELPELADVNSDWREGALRTLLHVDREAAARLGVSIRQLDAALSDAFGQRLVSTIYEPLNQYYVVLSVDPELTLGPAVLRQMRIAGSQGMVPLTAVARIETTPTPLAINHQGAFAASTISFNLAPGTTLDQAAQAIDQAFLALHAPDSIRAGLAGTAQVFQDSLDSQPLLILAALIAAYIVLGILYESYLHPLTILSTLPSASIGALLALLVSSSELSVIALIGIFLLVGIVMKNAIMMIDLALSLEREQGLAPLEAIHQAAIQRLRPILMTTLAAAMGAVPLVLALGDGSELRQPLGIAIVGGLLISQWLTLYTTPVVYLTLERWRGERSESEPARAELG